jgi:bacteriocin-like protein
MDPKEMAGNLGVDPEKIDFKLTDKELDHVSGGAGIHCGDIGSGSDCTKTGVSTGCTEIGVFGRDCTKAGM